MCACLYAVYTEASSLFEIGDGGRRDQRWISFACMPDKQIGTLGKKGEKEISYKWLIL